MFLTRWLCFTVVVLCQFIIIWCQPGISFPNLIHFPYGSPYMGLIIAVATPLDLQNIDAFVAWSFEASYNLPTNQTNFTYPPILSRAFDFISRKSLYEVVETRIAKFGYEGKQCLLRAICEATAYTFDHNGVLGDLLHLVLRPTSSENEHLPADYTEAEKIGEENANCTKYTERCPVSLLDMITKLDENSDTDTGTDIATGS
ncbi:uncharacterized protein LOC108742155 [Agrilus planipennis]|uniref:Uncharacterized protein LOC108742155 n=1 Tax=Agrilus planipennis TaxID=224129 RepID=A0A1W4X9C3_AGRPL|nr:uncharacterized protein LOC108742155 [Agrilus planipennis]